MTSSGETSLLAILLVASSPRLGPQVLFSYPAFPNPLPRLNKPVYPASTDKHTRQRLHHRKIRGQFSKKATAGSSSESDAYLSDSDAASEHPWYTGSETSSTTSGDDPQEDEFSSNAPHSAAHRGDGSEYTHFLGIENNLLASSLIPGRKELRDTKFEFVIDHLSFVGHPVHLDRGREKRAKAANEEKQQQQQQHRRQKSNTSSKELNANSPFVGAFSPMPRSGAGSSRHGSPALTPLQDNNQVLPLTPVLQARSMAQVSHTTSATASISQQNGRLESESVSSSSPLPPVAGMSSSIVSLGDLQLPPPASANEEGPLPIAATLLEAAQEQRRQRSVSANSAARENQALEAFNVVLVVDTPPDRHLSSHLQVYYQDIVLKLTAAIKYEELRDGWLSSEAATALKVRDDAREQGRPLNSCIDGLIHCSSLCAALAEAFEAISNRKVARLTSLNHHIDIQLIVHDEVFDRKHVSPNFSLVPHGTAASTSAVLRPPEASKATLAPHQTLIPKEDPSSILHELEKSPPSDLPLTQFLEIMTPSLNFQEYAALLDIDMAALQAMVQHLIYWRKARLSNVVSLRNIYRPTEQIDVARLPTLAEAYSRRFSTLPPLVSILAALRQARPFVEALQIPVSQSRRSAYLEMLIWLLSQSLVVELRVYYRLVANTEIKWKAAQSDPTTAPKLQSRVSSDADSFINQTRSLSLTDSPTSSHFLSTPLESPARPSAFTQRHSSVASGVSESHSNAGTSPVPIPGQAPQQLSGTSGMSGLITGASSFRSQDAPNPGDLALNEASVIAEPGEANSVERKWLEKMVEGKDPEIVGGFQKIMPFLNGQHDWEEILFRSGLTRRQTKRVFEEIAEHLVVFYI